MSEYNKLSDAASNILRLLNDQNESGSLSGKFDGWEPFDVLVSKVVYNLANAGISLGEVVSVNGETGAVILTKTDVGLSLVPNVNATNAANISSGTLGSARMPAHTGDVTSNAGSVALTIANDVVTYAKMQNVSGASKLLGRGASAAGDVEEITLGSGLTMTGTTLSASGGGGTGDVTAAAAFAADNRVLRSDGTGKGAQASALTISDAGDLTGVNNITISGALDFGNATFIGQIPTANIATTLTSKKLSFSGTLAADDTYDGIQITGRTAATNLVQWDVVYLTSSSTWDLADASAAGKYPARGIAVAAFVSGNAATILTQGTVRNDEWNWTPSLPIYLMTNSGDIIQTPPSGSGQIVQQVGYAITGDIAYFDFNSTYLTIT